MSLYNDHHSRHHSTWYAFFLSIVNSTFYIARRRRWCGWMMIEWWSGKIGWWIMVAYSSSAGKSFFASLPKAIKRQATWQPCHVFLYNAFIPIVQKAFMWDGIRAIKDTLKSSYQLQTISCQRDWVQREFRSEASSSPMALAASLFDTFFYFMKKKMTILDYLLELLVAYIKPFP